MKMYKLGSKEIQMGRDPQVVLGESEKVSQGGMYLGRALTTSTVLMGRDGRGGGW